jgi:Polyketide cyclase / dehydrase and lipid transport
MLGHKGLWEKTVLYELSRTVAARPQTVFRTVADIMEWPRIIEAVRSVEMLTSGPIRVGTRLKLTRVLFGHELTSEVEVAVIDPPRRLRLLSEGGEIPYEQDHQIDAVYMAGTRLMLIFQTMSDSTAGRTAVEFITPVVWTGLREELERDLDDLVAAIPPDA